MNKPKAVIFILLVLVILVFVSAFAIDSHASIRSVSAHAHVLQTISPAPTIPYTPEAFIPVEMFALNKDGAARKAFSCGQENSQLYYGCTAFCRDDDPEADRKCHKERILPYPYESDPAPRVSVENDYLPDVLSQEMGPSYENSALRAGAIVMRSFGLQQFEELNFQGLLLNNSTRYQTFIPYRFNTFNPEFPNSTCGLPDPLINRDQRKICDAVAPRYYLSPDYNDYPARANHIGDIRGDTETAYNAEGGIDRPYLIGVADPISFSCDAYNANVDQRYGTSQSGINRWARGDQCSLAGNGNEPWSVIWTRPEQILFHYFTRVHLRDANNGKQIISPARRWNPLRIQWGTTDNQPPVMQPGGSYNVIIQIQNTGIYPWTCTGVDGRPIPDSRYDLRYYWSSSQSIGPWRLGQGKVSVCDIQPGDPSPDKKITIDDIPAVAGQYILHFDINDTVTNSWFRLGGWPAYDVSVQVVIPLTPTPSPSPSPTPTTCGNDC
jgi:hypothetical protein